MFYNWKDLSLEGVVWGTFEGPQSDLDSDRVDEMTAASTTINQQSPIQEIIYTQIDKYLTLEKNIHAMPSQLIFRSLETKLFKRGKQSEIQKDLWLWYVQ